MKEIGALNRDISRLLSEQGHSDLLMVCDAGFATPKEIEVIDISLSENQPTVVQTLDELKKFFSVEKMVLANQTQQNNPSLFKAITENIFENVECEVIDHSELKKLAKEVKGIIRTGDFTSYANVILISGAGKRWYSEKSMST